VPPTPTPPDPPDLLEQLAGWLGDGVSTLIRELADPDAAATLLGELEWQGNLPTPPAAPDGQTLAEIALAFGALADALLAADNSIDATTAAELVADAIELILAWRMRQDHPAIWASLRAFEVLLDDRPQLANLGELFSHPKQYFAALPTGIAPSFTGQFGGPPYVQEYAGYSLILGVIGGLLAYFARPIPNLGPRDWLDPHGHDVNAFGLDVLYGWAPASLDELDPTSPHNPQPHLLELLPRMLTIRADLQSASTSAVPAGVHDVFDLTLALVPKEHFARADAAAGAEWGLYARLSGLVELDFPLGDKWQLSVKPSEPAAIEALLVDDSRGGFVRGASTTGYGATVAVERPADASGAWVLGPKDGSHIEIQHARASLTIEDDDQRGLLFDVGVHSDHFIVDIELGTDSFVRAVLPPSLRFDTKLGLGVELGKNGRGFYLDGGVTLVVDLPVDLPPLRVSVGTTSLVEVVVQGLHLRIGLTEADQGGDGRAGASFAVALTLDAAVQIADGHITATVAGVGYQYALKEVPAGTSPDGKPTVGRWQPTRGVVPPTGVGLVVKAGPVTGGGFIAHDPVLHEYSGALQFHASIAGYDFDLTALGLLDTEIPGHEGDWALLVILTMQGTYPLAGGFQLTGLGGVFGHNHTIDSDAIAAGLRTKALDAILFPPNPVVQAPHIFAVWRQTLPVADGSTVVGLMFQFSWGSKDLSEFQVALLVDIATPVQTVLLVSLKLHAPSTSAPVFRVRADGIARLPNFLFQAELIDSKLGSFPVTGGLVAVARESPDKAYLISVGGFNPHFTPPANVPAVDRLRIDISSGSNPRVRLELYAALTSQTVQLGARLQLHAAAGPLAIDGWLAFDGLVRSDWTFSLEVGAGLSLSFDNSPLFEIALDILVEGPGNWYVHGYASLSLLFITYSLPIEYGLPQTDPPTSQVVEPISLVRDALSQPVAWSAPPPGTSSVVLFKAPAAGVIAAHPLAAVSCTQPVVPLGLQITHVGNQALAAPATVDVTGLTLGGATAPDVSQVTDDFAPGQFLELTDDEKLSRPSFEPMRSGVAAGGTALDAGNATVVATTYKTVVVDGATRTTRPKNPLDLAHANAVLRPLPPPTARPAPVRLDVRSDTLRTFTGATSAVTASIAGQHAGAQPLLDLVGVAGAQS
jgi:hypothetical protein